MKTPLAPSHALLSSVARGALAAVQERLFEQGVSDVWCDQARQWQGPAVVTACQEVWEAVVKALERHCAGGCR